MARPRGAAALVNWDARRWRLYTPRAGMKQAPDASAMTDAARPDGMADGYFADQ
jgi:hypothetical protein